MYCIDITWSFGFQHKMRRHIIILNLVVGIEVKKTSLKLPPLIADGPSKMMFVKTLQKIKISAPGTS